MEESVDLDRLRLHWAVRDRYALAEVLHTCNVPIRASRAARWVTHLAAYESFCEREGRAPRRTVGGGAALVCERRLADWARRQRKGELALTRFQHLRLGAIASFAWEPLTAAWALSRSEVVTLARTIGRMPRRRAEDPREREAAYWLARQRQALTMETTPHSRRRDVRLLLRELDKLFPPS